MKKIIINIIALGVMSIALLTGCVKDATYVVKNDTAFGGTVSFSKDLQPIFTTNCAISGCHADGGKSPVLAAGKAYTSLKSGQFVDTTTAANSIIYRRLTGKITPAMPMGGAYNPSNIVGLVLAWVQQGAKNN